MYLTTQYPLGVDAFSVPDTPVAAAQLRLAQHLRLDEARIGFQGAADPLSRIQFLIHRKSTADTWLRRECLLGGSIPSELS